MGYVLPVTAFLVQLSGLPSWICRSRDRTNDKAASSRKDDRSVTSTKWCCAEMKHAVEDPDIPIVYVAKFREFGIRVLDGGSSKILLRFCPWSGTKLPDSLRDAWFKELDHRGIDPHGDNVPEEFCDERWYLGKSGT
jgi:hypothetical protein